MSHLKETTKGGKPQTPTETKKAATPARKVPARPTPADGRPRAQVAYEGDDEFSILSTDPRRVKPKVDLTPAEKRPVVPQTADVEDQPQKGGVWHFVRKIFGE